MDTGALKTRGLPVRLPCRSPSCVLLAACCPRPAGPRGAGACPPGTWVSSEPLGQEAALEEREGPTPLVPYLGLTGPPPPHPQKGGCVLGHQEGVQAWGQGRACAGEGAAAGPTGLPFPGPGTWGGRSGVNPTSQAPWKGRGTEGPSSAAETDLRETQANGFISNIIN